MESIKISQNRLSREEILVGVGGSLLVHIVILAVALVSPLAMPRNTFKGSVYSVNLVSLQDMGIPAAAVKKGTKEGTGESTKARSTQKAAASSSQARSEPVVPVKRLQMDEPVSKPSTEIKRIEPQEVPKIADRPRTAPASVEKDLEKLLPKQKSLPKPAPIVQNAREETESRPTAQESAPKAAQASVAGEKPTGKPAPAAGTQEPAGKGSPQGTAKGSADGSPTGTAEVGAKGSGGAGSAGTPDGGRVATALLSMYGDKVRELINRYWAVPDSVKPQGLEARLIVVVSREGNVLDLRVERGSGNSLFDESAVRAVRKASPLPPLPQLYSFPKVELGLRFRPEGLS